MWTCYITKRRPLCRLLVNVRKLHRGRVNMLWMSLEETGAFPLQKLKGLSVTKEDISYTPRCQFGEFRRVLPVF